MTDGFGFDAEVSGESPVIMARQSGILQVLRLEGLLGDLSGDERGEEPQKGKSYGLLLVASRYKLATVLAEFAVARGEEGEGGGDEEDGCGFGDGGVGDQTDCRAAIDAILVDANESDVERREVIEASGKSSGHGECCGEGFEGKRFARKKDTRTEIAIVRVGDECLLDGGWRRTRAA